MQDNTLRGALSGERCRVIVSTDIGGSDPDDFQSMVHYLLYSDLFDTEGLISSPWGQGRASDILTVIDKYEQDYPKLRTWSQGYPAPDELRRVTKQGALSFAPYKGWSKPTDGSEQIIKCARRRDERPLYVLVWGLLEDLAQALHDAPDILGKLRVYYIGGPNKKWGQNAYAYINEAFPDLWMIENNSTYRGWFCGGDMSGRYGNKSFVSECASGRGALGDYFITHLGGIIKMGDTPSVAWLLRGAPDTPEAEGWGGSFERVNAMPSREMLHPAATDNPTEVFAVVALIFKGEAIAPTEKPVFTLEIRNQQFEGFYMGGGEYRARFVPKETGDFAYVTHSAIPSMNGLTGVIRAITEKPESRCIDGGRLTSRWSDKLDISLSEGAHRGAKTVSKWRREFLDSFAERLSRCAAPKA